MASGTIELTPVRLYRLEYNSQTYTFNVGYTDTNRFRGGILVQLRHNIPVMWMVTTDVGSNPAVTCFKIPLTGVTSSTNVDTATMSNTTLTIKFNELVYGGTALIWFD